MSTKSLDHNLLEKLAQQQQDLMLILDSTCDCVAKCGCSDKVEAVKVQLALLQEEISRGRSLTQELSENLEEETALVDPASEQFEYWNK